MNARAIHELLRASARRLKIYNTQSGALAHKIDFICSSKII
jgi:hypothetical protein